MKKLTDRQQRFVEEYMVDLNATQAAIRAGYSAKNASKIGPEVLGKTRVRAAVDRARAEQSTRTGITADRVLRELAKIGFADITDVADFDTALARKKAERDDTAAIQTLKVKRTPTEEGYIVEREIKMHDKVKSLDLIGRHLGIFDNKLKIEGEFQVNFTGDDNLPDDD